MEKNRAEVSGNTNQTLKSRNWVFTEFKLKEDHSNLFPEDLIKKYNIKAYIYQLEECPSTKRLHYQGSLSFNTAYSQQHCIKLLSKARWRIRKGNADSNMKYCSKSESKVEGPWEYGTLDSEQGKRSDLLECRDMIMDGSSIQSLVETDSVGASTLRYMRSLERYQLMRLPMRFWPMEIFLFVGKPGTGKTSAVIDLLGEDKHNLYIKDSTEEFWEGYVGQENVLLEEFNGSSMHRGVLLQLLDRYPMRVKIKGASAQFCSKRIFITSNYHPLKWYKDSEAVIRRLREFGFCLNFDTDEELNLDYIDPN